MRVTVHQYWHDDNPPHPVLRNYLSSKYVLKVWMPDTLPADILNLLDDLDHKVPLHDLPRHRANIIRLYLLAEFGGVWLDMDAIPITSLAHPSPFVAAHGTCMCNCIMSFPALHPMILSAMRGLSLQPYGPSIMASGERYLNRLLTDDVELRQLPFDSTGHPISGGSPWAIHLYETSGARHLDS